MKITIFHVRLALTTGMLALWACGWGQPGIHEVRVKNNYLATFTTFKVGDAVFYNIEPGETETYQPVDHGEQKVVGECPPAGKVEGTLTFSGSGKNSWTVVVGESSWLTLIKDD
jgi:hypothetical protein